MTDQDPGGTRSGINDRSGPIQRPCENTSVEPASSYGSDCQSAVAAQSYQGRAGSYAPYYAHGPAGYQELSDRFSMGYQRMGQTITLTSHKIQFGCQGHTHHAFAGPRCDGGSVRHQYHMLPPTNKPWLESCPERQQSNTKSNNRGRTTYSDDQIAELESVFNNNPYPTSQTRQRLAYKIDVPEGKVKIWFQNRRARAKKSKLACAGSWRPSQNDPRNVEDRANHNNNNAKEISSKSTSSDSTVPIGAILPLPTKSSISASGWSSHMHPWSARYEDCSRNVPRFEKTLSQNPSCVMRSNCFCQGSASHFPPRIMQTMDRCSSAVPALALPTSSTYAYHENRPLYAFNEFSSPPPIRRLIYPFHTLTENGVKPERKTDDSQFSLQSAVSSESEYSNTLDANFPNFSFVSCPHYARSAYPTIAGQTENVSSTFTQLQRADGKWDSVADVTGGDYGSRDGSNSESSFDRGIAEPPALSRGQGNVDDENNQSVTADDAIDEPRMLECFKNDDGTRNEDKSLTSFSNVQSTTMPNGYWVDRTSSNILVKAMEYAEGDTFADKSGADDLNVVSRLADMNTGVQQTIDPANLWPNQFSGNMYPTASASLVG